MEAESQINDKFKTIFQLQAELEVVLSELKSLGIVVAEYDGMTISVEAGDLIDIIRKDDVMNFDKEYIREIEADERLAETFNPSHEVGGGV